MLDFQLERQIDWASAFREPDPSRRLAIWEQVEALRSPTPFVEQLETTNACPLTCVMCPRGQGLMTREVRHMDDDLFRAIGRQIEDGWQARKGTPYDPSRLVPSWSRDAIESLGLRLHHFGSPLMDPRFIPRVEWLKAECTFPVHASLSAEHLRGDQARRLVASGIDRIVVALDGVDEETYRARRGRAASYARACAGIEAMLEAREALGADTVIDVQLINIGQDADVLESYREHWTARGACVFIKGFFPYPDIAVDAPAEHVWRGPCRWPFLSMVVSVDGRVLPCCADYDAEEVLGDLRAQTLQEVWDGGPFREFRRRFFLGTPAPDSLCGRCGFYGGNDAA